MDSIQKEFTTQLGRRVREVSNLSKAVKALILTWIMIGFVVAGLVGFYLGRITAPKTQSQNPPGMQQPTGGQQPPRGATPSAAPSGPSQGGQQPAGQPPPQK